MKCSVRDDILRYEVMIGLCDYVNPSNPEEADQDRAAYGAKYVPRWEEDGTGALSSAYVMRFLVEVCGHSYEEALIGMVEEMRTWPMGKWPDITPDQHARNLLEQGGDIIETLFNLKVGRLTSLSAEKVAFYREATQALTRLPRKPLINRSHEKTADDSDPSLV